jgi:hypothetical protein
VRTLEERPILEAKSGESGVVKVKAFLNQKSVNVSVRRPHILERSAGKSRMMPREDIHAMTRM